MGSYNLTGKYESILSSLSNDMSVEQNKKISKSEVLKLILDIVIEEERLLPEKSDEQPVSFFRRKIYKLPSNNSPNLARVKVLSKND